ncbi:MAG: OB-fold nucleic acid binding domain-containing protein, partial [Sphaerochaetaceae bacterium]
MEYKQRTVTCGQLTKEDVDKTVVLNGWVHRNRNHGGINFVDLRDRYGITQLVVDKDADPRLLDVVEKLRMEYCIAAEGTVRLRPSSMINKEMRSGEIEVVLSSIE